MSENRLVEYLSALITAITVQIALSFIWMMIADKVESFVFNKIEATDWARKSKKDK